MEKSEIEQAIHEIKNGINRKTNYQKVYDANRWLINKVARRYLYANVELNDLKQEAYFAVVNAVNGYDPTSGAFGTYLEYHLKSVFWKFTENSSLVRMPLYQKEKILKYINFRNDHFKKYGKEPSDLLYRKALELSQNELEQLRKDLFAKDIKSADKPILNDHSEPYTVDMPDPNDYAYNVESKIDSELVSKQLWKMVDDLPRKESDIIRKRYQNGNTYEEIAKEDGCSISNIAAKHNKAIRHLKQSKELKKLEQLLDYEVTRTKALHGSGLTCFRNTGTSSTEYFAIQRYETEKQIRNLKNNMQKCNLPLE